MAKSRAARSYGIVSAVAAAASGGSAASSEAWCSSGTRSRAAWRSMAENAPRIEAAAGRGRCWSAYTCLEWDRESKITAAALERIPARTRVRARECMWDTIAACLAGLREARPFAASSTPRCGKISATCSASMIRSIGLTSSEGRERMTAAASAAGRRCTSITMSRSFRRRSISPCIFVIWTTVAALAHPCFVLSATTSLCTLRGELFPMRMRVTDADLSTFCADSTRLSEDGWARPSTRRIDMATSGLCRSRAATMGEPPSSSMSFMPRTRLARMWSGRRPRMGPMRSGSSMPISCAAAATSPSPRRSFMSPAIFRSG
mmetsp:Transcript_56165/g.177987  ORF Transcript_56165/g.177987 Transcript_56165/m.177987 type:complete len:319 (+) Transcript_56165:2414-3370(+)